MKCKHFVVRPCALCLRLRLRLGAAIRHRVGERQTLSVRRASLTPVAFRPCAGRRGGNQSRLGPDTVVARKSRPPPLTASLRGETGDGAMCPRCGLVGGHFGSHIAKRRNKGLPRCSGFAEGLPKFRPRAFARSSQQTRRRREMDSNFRFPATVNLVVAPLVPRGCLGWIGAPERGCRGSARLSCAASHSTTLGFIRVEWVCVYTPHDRLLNTNNPRILLLHPVYFSARRRRD